MSADVIPLNVIARPIPKPAVGAPIKTPESKATVNPEAFETVRQRAIDARMKEIEHHLEVLGAFRVSKNEMQGHLDEWMAEFFKE